ncbi:hypothetical protein MM236_00830 [Belliella sp. DSM 107340]|uniref:Uncharacterized protein n=1 Tax=Belliella calami TaxID=2923436 RepID=A0ABS9UJG2_9BACT|nr:hypothetical protein [Belliella calami]MCH7396504.1 hypothetical protein [Belliella calami]
MNLYPTEILPCSKFKRISCDLSPYYLIRYTSEKENLVNADTGKLKVETICSPREHIEDLSTSLLGSYTYKHIQIELTTLGKESYAKYCSPDFEVDPVPIFETHFTLDSERGFWKVLIGKIENQIADFSMGNNFELFRAQCKILHTPMRWNYWHFSVRWFLIEKGMYLYEIHDERERKRFKKKLANEARALIAQYARVEKCNYPILPTDKYLL